MSDPSVKLDAEYIPTTDTVRAAFAAGMADVAPAALGLTWDEARDFAAARFDKWLGTVRPDGSRDG